MPAYKYNRNVDTAVKSTSYGPLYNIDTGKPVVAPGLFQRRVDAQITERKKLENQTRKRRPG